VQEGVKEYRDQYLRKKKELELTVMLQNKQYEIKDVSVVLQNNMPAQQTKTRYQRN
jgi:hypothetical protein